MTKIYLDNAATTAVDPVVKNAMNPYFTEQFANASSVHILGQEARMALEDARTVLAKAIGADSKEVIFTGSGTEANNLVLKGLFFEHHLNKNHIITTAIEHDCVLNACKWLESQGAVVTYLPVDNKGFVNPKDVADAITEKTLVVSVIHGNNEIGTIQDLRVISSVCKEKGVLFHTDACQSFTKVPINVVTDGIDLMTLNAHKIHGPKGVGGLYIRKGIHLQPLLHGGGQEFGLRSSTENVAGIVGFAKAVSIASPKDIEQMKDLQNWFFEEVSKWEGIRVNGPLGDRRLCNNINLSLFMIEGELVRNQMSENGICISTGSACSSSSTKISHVMKAINCPMEYVHGNIRVSISKWTTKKELQQMLQLLKKIIGEYKMHEV